MFSQLDKSHGEKLSAEHSLIVSNEGLHLADQKLLPFSNEQPPTKMAMLVLSAMVLKQPLQFKCPDCDWTRKINWGAELNTDLVNDAVQTALKTKKLFRYQYKETTSDVTKLETEITQYVNCKYALAVSSATNGIF